MPMTEKLQHTHAEGNCHFPTQLMERCKELDETFKVVFLVHDDIRFECRKENREAIMELMVDHTCAVLKEGHATLDVNMKVSF